MRLRLREATGPLPATNPEDYRKILNQILAEIGDITGSAETAMIRVLDEARKAVVAELAELALDSGTAQMYQRTLEGIDEAVANLAQTMGSTIADYQKQGFVAGIDLATKPLAGAKGFEIVASAITEDQLQILSRFSADLIQDMTSTLRTRINGEIASVVVGAKTPGQAATAIGKNLASKNHFSTIAHRARAIVVTETGRAQALGTQAAQERLVRDIADAGGGFQVRKQWLNAHLPGARQTHLEAEARYGPDGDPGPIPVDADFEIAGITARYPRDPSLPPGESVNCHCVALTVVIEGDPEIDDEPDEQPAAGLTAGQKFGPSVSKKPDLLYVNAQTGKAYAKKTPIYEVDGKLQTASGQPVTTQPKTISIDTPDQKVAAQTAYTAAKVDAAAPAKVASTAAPNQKVAKFLDDPYAAAGLKAEKPLSGGSNGFGGEPMTKALGYPDPKMSGFVWDGELGGWRHPKAPPGKQLPAFADLSDFEKNALMDNAGLKLTDKGKTLQALGFSPTKIDNIVTAKPPAPKPNLTPTPPPPPPVKPPVTRSASTAKANAELAKIPREKGIKPAALDRIDVDAPTTGTLLPGQDEFLAKTGGGGVYAENQAWKERVMRKMAQRLEDDLPVDRIKALENTGHYSTYFGDTPAERISAGMVQSWASSSGDARPPALALQRAVAEVFDLPWPPVGYTGASEVVAINRSNAIYDEWRDVLEAFVRNMHAETQDVLDEIYPGQDSIRLVRGFRAGRTGTELGEIDMVGLNPASSFSVDTGTSTGFGETMLVVDVPKERILGTPFSGYGCLNEFEFVVIGAPGEEAMIVIGKSNVYSP